jgi:hypothetical protein
MLNIEHLAYLLNVLDLRGAHIVTRLDEEHSLHQKVYQRLPSRSKQIVAHAMRNAKKGT